MHFVIPPVVPSPFPETNDPALHRTPLSVLLELVEYCPILSNAETFRCGARRHLSRTQHVEDEDAAGDERVVNAPEKAAEPPFLVLRVEEVVEDLAYGRNGLTAWDLDLEQRSKPELGLGHPVARERDHSLGNVDPQYPVSSVYELSRPQTTAATEVDYEAVANPITVHDLQYARRRSKGELGMPDVVYVRDVLPVPPRRVRTSRGYFGPP